MLRNGTKWQNVASNKFWSSLTPAQQTIVRDAMKAANAREWELLVGDESSVKQKLITAGVKITVPDATFRAQLEQAVQSSYKTYYSAQPEAEEIVKKIRDLAK